MLTAKHIDRLLKLLPSHGRKGPILEKWEGRKRGAKKKLPPSIGEKAFFVIF
jgi:hypothetical protein